MTFVNSQDSNPEESNKFTVLTSESQDDSPDPKLTDFWDSLTSMIAEKMEKDKGKKKI